MPSRIYSDADKALIAGILGKELTRAKVRQIAKHFRISFNAAVGIGWRVLNPRMPTINPRRLAKQLADQEFAALIKKLSRRFHSRRKDADRSAKLSWHERRMATWLRNRGHDVRTVAAVLNIDARIIAGYFVGHDRARLPRPCKHCHKRRIPPGRHFYCSDACAQAVIKIRQHHYHRTRKRKKTTRLYYYRVRNTEHFKQVRKAHAKAYKSRPAVKVRRSLLWNTREIARERGVPHTQILDELGIERGRVKAGPLGPKRKSRARDAKALPPKRRYEHYTPEQDRLIMANGRTRGSDKALAAALGRAVTSIQERRRYIRNLMKGTANGPNA